MTEFWLMYWNVDKPKGPNEGQRLDLIGRVIAGCVDPPPSLIALSEVGNCHVLGPLAAQLSAATDRTYEVSTLHGDDQARDWLDSGVIYDAAVLRKPQLVAGVRGGTHHLQTRRCVVAQCELIDGAGFDLYINHWYAQGGHALLDDAKRRELARWVCLKVSERGTSRVVAVGDFNVEPHDPAMLFHAPLAPAQAAATDKDEPVFGSPLATRQMPEASSATLPLYSTAWHLQDSQRLPLPTDGTVSSRRLARGSYHFKTSSTWHCLDQLLVSPKVLHDDRLLLDRDSVHWATPEVVGGAIQWDAEKPDRSLSDHLPLLARFTY